MSDNTSAELRQLWAAVRHAQRLSEKIRERLLTAERADPAADEGIAVVPIKERDLVSRPRLIRRTAR